MNIEFLECGDTMNILIAESNPGQGEVWSGHLRRQGATVTVCPDRDCAIDALTATNFQIIILNLELGDGDALSIADYAAYQCPETKVIFVTGSTFFTDGSIFTHCPNACACLPEDVAPQDLAALVEYHSTKAA